MKLLRFIAYDPILERILKAPKLTLTAVMVLTVILGLGLFRLQLKTSLHDLVIRDLPETAYYEETTKLFGEQQVIQVVAKGENVLAPETFAHLERLDKRLSRIPGVERTISLPSALREMAATGMTLDKFRDIIGPVKLFDSQLISRDQKVAGLTLVLDDSRNPEELVDRVTAILKDEENGLSLYSVGMPNVSLALGRYTQQDFFRLPPITYGVIAVLLLILFRSVQGVLFPLSSITLALVWTIGLMGWTGTALSMLTMITPVFLIAVGTAYCLHFVTAYARAVEKGCTAEEAARRVCGDLRLPTSLAVGTTIVGLGSLVVNRIDAIRDFALFSCVGMFFLLIILLTWLPALIAAYPSPEASQRERKKDLVDRFLQGVIHLNLHHQKKLFAFFIIMAVVGLIGVFKIRVETNPCRYFRADAPVLQNFHAVYQDLCGSFPVNVVVRTDVPDFFEDPENLAKLAGLSDALVGLDKVDKAVSVADYLRLAHYASNQYEGDAYVLPDQGYMVRMDVNTMKTMIGGETLARFVTQDFSSANILLLTHISGSSDFLNGKRDMEAICRQFFGPEAVCRATGFGIVISATSDLVTQGQVKSLSITMVLVFGMMFLLFLSFKAGATAILPNMFPIIMNFGIMGWMGVELSLVTSLIASIAIGLAVDDTIHYLFHYNDEFKKDLDEKRALAETLATIGRPIVFTTLTIGLGFSVLVFSGFRPTALFGVMMVLTMMAALVGDLILLPTLMLHVPIVTLWDVIRLRMGRTPDQGMPIFKGLSRHQIHYVLLAGSLRNMAPGEILFRKGDPSASMYAILSGNMEVLDSGQAGETTSFRKRMHVALLPAGEIVGEMGLVRKAPRSATVVAGDGVEVLEISRKMIQRLQWLYPPAAYRLCFNLMGILADRLEATTHSLAKAGLLDDATGLPGQDAFLMELSKEGERSRRFGYQVGVGILELQEPEQAPASVDLADQMLEKTGRLLTKMLPKHAVLARLDDRQFGVLVSDRDECTLEEACQDMFTAVKEACEAGVSGWRPGVAMGFVVSGDTGAGSGGGMLFKALDALKSGKANGGKPFIQKI
ncbi:cyclic nucleotide-binding protein [Desulfatibacillum aliphaticivorans]|uniref:Cyclic nucleotide-binding protein n=1 Tax=Desulfatibacillum aliphaticivorans TaxID=218208 RepID=B8FHD2_DESAL|nr:MMPL family transporter [Desulfatibacillum aliphaticivorans]ACL02220.1 cyclic nucleotide-binding protein [Desulfatibacillum aliphaticivorans]